MDWETKAIVFDKLKRAAVRQERMEQIAVDTKKEFYYSKDGNCWAWADRGEAPDFNRSFPTRYDALHDAVEPYID